MGNTTFLLWDIKIKLKIMAQIKAKKWILQRNKLINQIRLKSLSPEKRIQQKVISITQKSWKIRIKKVITKVKNRVSK
jgi:hypothetical protein